MSKDQRIEHSELVARVARGVPSAIVQRLSGKTLSIVGASGLIGSSIVEVIMYLRRERGLDADLLLHGRNAERMRSRFGDPMLSGYRFSPFDAASFEPPAETGNLAIYCAGNSDPARISAQPVETILANTAGLACYLEAMQDRGGTRMVYVSSSEIYGPGAVDHPYRESDHSVLCPLMPRFSYPVAKAAGEALCVAYGAERGIDAISVRPGHVYGPNVLEDDSHASTQFARAGLMGGPITLKSDGCQRRSYCHSLDVASGILTALASGEPGAAYNAAAPSSTITLRELAEAIAEVAGSRLEFSDPDAADRAAANPMHDSTLDGAALMKLGWAPKVSLAEGVADMLANLKTREADT